MWIILTSGLLLGMISSLHCIGMCGPLALSLPIRHYPRSRQIMSLALFHFARILTYATLGSLFGLLGRHLYLAGLQQGLSLLLGCTILIILIYNRRGWKTWQPALQGRIYHRLMPWIKKIWQSPSTTKFFFLGMTNGLLPCGMVYLAIAVALSLSKLTDALIFMTAFGAGTLPLLLLLSFAGGFLKPALRSRLHKLTPLFIAFTASLLILRGLNLGIPFISPVLPSAPGTSISCH